MTLKLWDLESGTDLCSFTGEASFGCVAIASDARRVVCGDSRGRVHLFELRL